MRANQPILSTEDKFLELMAIHISECVECYRSGDPFPLIATSKAIGELCDHLRARDQAIQFASQMGPGIQCEFLHLKLSEN